MLNFITRKFSSLWSFITAPFRALWRLVVHVFPERDFTVMDTPRGNVYSFHQSSFWRFARFCGKFGLIIWATWSTYVFVYHRPLLQKRTAQLEEVKAQHTRQVSDMTVYLKKFNDLARELNVIDDKILNSKKLSQSEKDSLMKRRLNTWAELDFLQTRLATIFTDVEYSPEFTKLSELSAELELTNAENDHLKKQNAEMLESMQIITEADSQIIETVSKLSNDHIDALRKNMKKINGTLANLGLGETVMVERANKFSNAVVGAAFSPIDMDKKLDPKYQKLADNLELWHGLSRLQSVIPLGAPVNKPVVTSEYGMRTHPIYKDQRKHKGIDFAGQIGTPLLSVAPGRVISAGERVGYGKTVEIDHGLGFSTLYAHLSKINVVRGDWVRSGTIVGLGGSSGKSTGPHLHYEIRYNGAPFNPANFVKGK